MVIKSNLAVDACSTEEAGEAVPAGVAAGLVGVDIPGAAPGLVPELVHGVAGQQARQDEVFPAATFFGSFTFFFTIAAGIQLPGGAAGEAGGAEDAQPAGLGVGVPLAQAVHELLASRSSGHLELDSRVSGSRDLGMTTRPGHQTGTGSTGTLGG